MQFIEINAKWQFHLLGATPFLHVQVPLCVMLNNLGLGVGG
jgi:hypothetical protein